MKYTLHISNQLPLKEQIENLVSVTDLTITGRNFGMYNGEDLARAFAYMPSSVISLDLRNNELGERRINDLILVLQAIRPPITDLNLMNNLFRRYTTAHLLLFLGVIPATITSLDLSNNDLFYNFEGDVCLGLKSVVELQQIFAAISPSLSTLKLAHDGLGRYTAAQLVQAFSAIPANSRLTSLDLSYNSLHLKSDSEIIQIINSLPQSVNTVVCTDDPRVEHLFQQMRCVAHAEVCRAGLSTVDVASLCMQYVSGPTIWNEGLKKSLQDKKASDSARVIEENAQLAPVPAAFAAALQKMQVR